MPMFEDSDIDEVDEYVEENKSFSGWTKEGFAFAEESFYKLKQEATDKSLDLASFKAHMTTFDSDVLKAFNVRITIAGRQRLPSDVLKLCGNLEIIITQGKKYFAATTLPDIPTLPDVP